MPQLIVAVIAALVTGAIQSGRDKSKARDAAEAETKNLERIKPFVAKGEAALQRSFDLTLEQTAQLRPFIEALTGGGQEAVDLLIADLRTPIDRNTFLPSSITDRSRLLPSTERSIEQSNISIAKGLAPFGLSDSSVRATAVAESTAGFVARDEDIRRQEEFRRRQEFAQAVQNRRAGLTGLATLGTTGTNLGLLSTAQIQEASQDIASFQGAKAGLFSAAQISADAAERARRADRAALAGQTAGLFLSNLSNQGSGSFNFGTSPGDQNLLN